MLKERFDKTACAGLGKAHFVTKQDYDVVRDGPVFIFVKPMRDRPNSAAEIDKKKDIIHIVLTGWKGQYCLKHSRYFKVGYSSHSSPQDLEEFVKRLQPDNLVFNLDEKPSV